MTEREYFEIERAAEQDGRWPMNEAVGLEATLELPSLKVTLALAEVFAKVKFVPAPIRAVSKPE